MPHSDSWREKRFVDTIVRAVDRLAGFRGLQRIRRTKPVNRFADAAFHAQLVEESFAFSARELLGRPTASTYRARESSLTVTIRHRTADLYVLNEIVRLGAYEFPAEAQRRLEALGRPPHVVDAGANIGLFGLEVFARFPKATIDAFEPDPANAAMLERTIGANRLEDRWHVIRSCAGTADGTVMFAARGDVGSRIESSPDAISVPTADVFDYLRGADLFKMDVEGSEWPILSDARLADLERLVLVFEYHQNGAPCSDPRRAAFELVSRAGFTIYEPELPRQPEGTGILWGWK